MTSQNRLKKEKSPYLLQHADNPVDWYPWGEEAFEAAKSQDKPIFLSIGYATCHWCHVMEKESFEDRETAELLNDTFINIKVDREELPNVDNVYMDFAQALMSSAGGWPLNVVLTPDLKPFFAVTYLPPKGQKGLVGLQQFTRQIKELWQSDQRGLLVEQSEKIVEIFQKSIQDRGDELPKQEFIAQSIEMMFDIADPVYGGMKGEPKFPLSYQGDFLLSYAKLNSESRALFYVELTLDMMRRGGIYDHLGGGFARYTVDAQWQLPHFEKMLYDNVLIASSYLLAWKYTKNPTYEAVVRETLNYLLRDLKLKSGGFGSAEDADSEGREGLFYTWTRQEIQEVLSPEEAEIFCHFYGITFEGNFEGRNCLHIDVPLAEFAERWSIEEEELADLLASMREQLFKERGKRTRPFLDDKVITSWNGFAIDTFITAGHALEEEKYIDAAVETAQFIKENLDKDGQLYRRYREKEARFAGNLEDHAFLIKGLLSLFGLQGDSSYLQWAIDLTDRVERNFKVEGGAFYQVGEDEKSFLRKCEFYDGAEPSGNAVHCENLLRLYQLTTDQRFLSQAEDVLKAAKSYIESYPPGLCYHLIALMRYYEKQAPLIVVALDENRSFEKQIAAVYNQQYIPHAQIIWKKAGEEIALPTTEDKVPIEGKTAVYICKGNQCEAPLTGIEEIVKAIENL